MLARLDESPQVIVKTEEIIADYFKHCEDGKLRLQKLPRDLWIMIGRMAGLPTISAMMQSCRFFNHSFSPSSIPGRSLPSVTLAERVGYQIRSGLDDEVRKLLERAKQQSALQDIFTTETQVPLSRTKTFKKAPIIFTVLWSLDLYMYDLLKPYMNEETLIEQIREYNADDCSFTKEHGKHFDFQPIIHCWEKFSDYIESFSAEALAAIKEGSNEDRELQHLFQQIVTESAKLPMHVINQFLDTTRALVMRGSPVSFNEPTLTRSNTIVDLDDDSETVCDPLHSKGNDFGITYGVVRTQSKPLRVDVKDALRFAQFPLVSVTNTDGAGCHKSLARVHADAFKTLNQKYLQWQINVITNAVNSPVVSPKLAKA